MEDNHSQRISVSLSSFLECAKIYEEETRDLYEKERQEYFSMKRREELAMYDGI